MKRRIDRSISRRQDIVAVMCDDLIGYLPQEDINTLYQRLALLTRSAVRRGQFLSHPDLFVGRNSLINVVRDWRSARKDTGLAKFREDYRRYTISSSDSQLDEVYVFIKDIDENKRKKFLEDFHELIFKISYLAGFIEGRPTEEPLTIHNELTTW